MSKMISIIGNDGKTTLSYYLALKLATNGKKVMVVATNNQIPDMQSQLPEVTKGVRSLGKVLSLALINNQDILENMITIPHNDNVGFLSYGLLESKNTYPEISQSNIETFFQVLGSIVDYIIVDTQTINNKIDKYAIENSSHLLCITSANIKGLLFRQHMPSNLKRDITHILFNNSSSNPYEDISHTFNDGVKYHLPYIKSLQSIYNSELLMNTSCPVKYGKLISKIEKEVILGEC